MQVDEEAPPIGRSLTQVGAVAGASACAAATGLLAVVNLFAPSVPFPPLGFAQAVVRATPGSIATVAIETLGHLALPLAAFAIALLFVGLGAVAGIVALRLPVPETAGWAAAMVPLWGLSAAAAPLRSAGSLVAATIGAATSVVVGRFVAARLRAAPSADGGPADPTRRYLFRAGAAGAGGVLLALSGLSRIVRPTSDPGNQPLSLPSVSPAPSPPSRATDAGFAAVRGLTPEITPIEDFYTIDEAIVDPSLDPATWRLAVSGVVDRPGSLTYDDLRMLDAVERPQTLTCISNPVGGDLVSTAMWTGIPLRQLLERAGADRGRALEVVFHSADGYSDSLPFEQAMDPETLLAVGMNGRTLPRAHGYPVRLLSAGTYGMKNPKWITRIEVVDRPYDGYWEQRGWAKTAPVKTGARIDTLTDGQQIAGAAATTIAGVAFAGDRGIASVEVSTDDGQTWAPATLKSPLGPFTWRLWRYAWTPTQPGETTVVARATDGAGVVQTSEITEPHPAGASGLHRVSVAVT